MSERSLYEEVYTRSAECVDLEPVPGDFMIKKTGMDIIRRFTGIGGHAYGLEVGCGSGFNTALLAGLGSSIVATDLPYYDAATHSLGIKVARNTVARLGTGNVEILSCSGEALPFPDNTFDFVFSSSVLEHINNKEKALKEMLRVCKPGGDVVFVVPTFVQSICAFVHLYIYIVRRAFDVIYVKLIKKGGAENKTLLPMADDSTRSGPAIIGSFRKNHPSFPLPEPHGAYRNIFDEFANQLPWSWPGLARRCGARSIDTFAFLFLPFNILEVFSTKWIARLYSATKQLYYILGKSFLKHLSYSLCVIAKK